MLCITPTLITFLLSTMQVTAHGYISKITIAGNEHPGLVEADWYKPEAQRPDTSFRIYGGSGARQLP